MPNPFLGVRIPPELDAAIAARASATGQSKSDIAIAALECYLGLPSCHERLAAIEQRLAAIENLARHLVPSDRHSAHHAPHHAEESSTHWLPE